jgi:hypothetical protein
MKWEIFEDNYIASLFEQIYDGNDKKLEYIKQKIKRRGIEYLSLSEYNFIREKNKLPKISLVHVNDLLFDNLITYSDLYKSTGISRSMTSMILRGTRNTSIKALSKICNCISEKNVKVNKELILE